MVVLPSIIKSLGEKGGLKLEPSGREILDIFFYMLYISRVLIFVSLALLIIYVYFLNNYYSNVSPLNNILPSISRPISIAPNLITRIPNMSIDQLNRMQRGPNFIPNYFNDMNIPLSNRINSNLYYSSQTQSFRLPLSANPNMKKSMLPVSPNMNKSTSPTNLNVKY